MCTGLFEKDGHGYLMFANRDVKNRSTATIWLGSGTAPIERFDKTQRTWASESHPMDGSASQIAHLTVGLAPGDAALYRLAGGLPTHSVDEVVGEVLFGQVRSNAGTLYLVNSHDCQIPTLLQNATYNKRVRDHARGYLPQNGHADWWNTIHDSALKDADVSGNAEYNKRVRDHARGYLPQNGHADWWNTIHDSALRDTNHVENA